MIPFYPQEQKPVSQLYIVLLVYGNFSLFMRVKVTYFCFVGTYPIYKV